MPKIVCSKSLLIFCTATNEEKVFVCSWALALSIFRAKAQLRAFNYNYLTGYDINYQLSIIHY
ncbi:hypothetical protein [Dapis sp. BLCC M229]|uniref:hypothetical protein n=1 Tax=Dapis sp. BLCC M229 TaxID=3400188 RepID=UPI003CF95BF0